MALPCYLAMTPAEIQQNPALPPDFAWMACHFSPCDTGLSNLPAALPASSIIIVDDSAPIAGHCPAQILEQLQHIPDLGAVLLDFQRPGNTETMAVVKAIVSALPCPVGVSECYAAGLDCPVFLPPLPPGTLLTEYLQPWKGRQVWLEAALGSAVITVTPDGCQWVDAPDSEASGNFADSSLHCHYRLESTQNMVRFFLTRTPEDLTGLLEEASTLGVSRAIGLYQELGTFLQKGPP